MVSRYKRATGKRCAAAAIVYRGCVCVIRFRLAGTCGRPRGALSARKPCAPKLLWRVDFVYCSASLPIFFYIARAPLCVYTIACSLARSEKTPVVLICNCALGVYLYECMKILSEKSRRWALHCVGGIGSDSWISWRVFSEPIRHWEYIFLDWN